MRKIMIIIDLGLVGDIYCCRRQEGGTNQCQSLRTVSQSEYNFVQYNGKLLLLKISTAWILVVYYIDSILHKIEVF